MKLSYFTTENNHCILQGQVCEGVGDGALKAWKRSISLLWIDA